MQLQINGKILNLDAPCVMGVLNLTPDSFSDGGRYPAVPAALDRIGEMVSEGAAIIDIGGESTRPGSEPVPADKEWERIGAVLNQAVKLYPGTFFSVDTMKAAVAQKALDAGADLINDVSGLQVDPQKAALCAEYEAGLVIMHTKGMPKVMQNDPHYEDVVAEVKGFLERQAKFAEKAGIRHIIVDPGIGFGKTAAHNLQLIGGLEQIAQLPWPVLVGASRKSLIGNLLDSRPPEGRLAGTVSLHYHAMLLGARIIRVHDVREASDSIRILNAIKQFSKTKD